MTKEYEVEECRLEKIVFSNNTGFIIGAFLDKHNNKVTALGEMINPQINMEYILTGRWEENHKFGDQFKFHAYESIMPSDTNGIFKYIVRVCKFVGASVGNIIVEKYGEKTLEIMKQEPEKLAKEIKGITLERALKIQKALMENEKVEKIMVELEDLLDVPGMRKNLQSELIKAFKSDAAEAVKANPYIITKFRGISFFLADRVALNIGFARDSIERKKAAAWHVLFENMQEGNTWIFKNNLALKINELIQVKELFAGVQELVKDDVVFEDDKFFAFCSPAEDEMFIAEKIVKMVNI